jgi:hypothetical protein
MLYTANNTVMKEEQENAKQAAKTSAICPKNEQVLYMKGLDGSFVPCSHRSNSVTTMAVGPVMTILLRTKLWHNLAA